MVWCGVVWCGVVWCGVVWCGVVWCGVVWSVFLSRLEPLFCHNNLSAVHIQGMASRASSPATWQSQDDGELCEMIMGAGLTYPYDMSCRDSAAAMSSACPGDHHEVLTAKHPKGFAPPQMKCLPIDENGRVPSLSHMRSRTVAFCLLHFS